MPISREAFFNIAQDMYVHKSWVQAYMFCPLKFRRMVIDKTRSQPSYEMALGTEFHEFAKGFFSIIDLQHMDRLVGEKAIYEYFRTFTPSQLSPPVYGWIQNFFRFEANRYSVLKANARDPFKYYIPVLIEEVLRSEKFKLETTPDRIDLFDENSFIIVEYKAAQSMHHADWRRELAIQSILANERFDNKCKYIAVYNPKINVVWAERLKGASVANAHRQIARLRKAIADEEYPAKVSDRCMWCDYKAICLSEGRFENAEFTTTEEENSSQEAE